jgi:hypothetical protein
LPTEEAHANTIAKNMFAWWDLGATTAPYYISLRNWVVRGKVYPRWFGFFGFEDFVIDDHDNMTVKRYPGWYAFQTVAHTFYDRDKFRKPSFGIESSVGLSMFRAYEHRLKDGSELLLMLWNDGGPVRTRVDVGSSEYLHPVRIDVFNRHHWTDVPARVNDKGIALELEVGPDPAIIRLVRLQ